MLHLKNIDKDKFDEFVKNHKTKSHFLQSSAWGEFSKDNKGVTPYYLGLVDDKDKILATALLLQKKLPLNYSYFYCPRGFVIDYNNKELVKEMTQELKKFSKNKKGVYVKIDPDIKLHNLDLDGNVLVGEENYKLIDYLKTLGYKHLGFNKAFEHSQPRYTFRLELKPTIEEVINNFHNTTKKVINRGNIYDLEIEKNKDDAIEGFYQTMLETAKRENLSLHPIKYFDDFYKLLHKRNMSDIYIIYLNKKKTIKAITNKIKELNKYKDTLQIENKIKEIDNQITKQEKLLKEVKKVKEDKYPLSSIITAKFNDKVWTVHGGNSTILRELNSNYLIYFEIIKDALKEGYKTVDFFGTTYNPTTNDPDYGIWLFKKRLGGEYTEFIGELDLVTNKLMYFALTKLLKVYRNIKKKKRRKEIQNGTSNSN